MLDMTFLELVPILLTCFLFKNNLVNKQIIFHTDNSSLVSVLNKKILDVEARYAVDPTSGPKNNFIQFAVEIFPHRRSQQLRSRCNISQTVGEIQESFPRRRFISNTDIPRISEADLGTEIGRLVEASLATNTKETY